MVAVAITPEVKLERLNQSQWQPRWRAEATLLRQCAEQSESKTQTQQSK
jgi:hypothetical protein